MMFVEAYETLRSFDLHLHSFETWHCSLSYFYADQMTMAKEQQCGMSNMNDIFIYIWLV